MSKNRHKPFFLVKLQDLFRHRKEKNKHYSLRQYAQFLNLNSGTLSAILSGKRTIPSRKVETIIKKLALSEAESKLFLSSLTIAQKFKEAYFEISPDTHGHLYEELEYFIILSLFKRSGFTACRQTISQKTGIGIDKMEKYINELLVVGFLQVTEDGRLQRSSNPIHVVQEGHSPSLRVNHRNNLKMSLENLEKLSAEEYEYSHVTLHLDQEGFESLRKDLRLVRDRIKDRKQSDDEGHLYRVAIQIFPIAKKLI